MKKRYSLISLALGTFLTVGCAGTTATIDETAHQSHSHSTPGGKPPSNQNHSSGTDTTQKASSHHGKKETKQAKQPKQPKQHTPPKQPFVAVPPPKNAKPLQENYPAEVKKKMPTVEAHGGSAVRSVPLGQTLLKGKKDLTNGPLKNHRLVAFYGTPLSKSMGVLGQSSPAEMMKQLKQQAAAYSALDPAHPAIPTIELIATSAQRKPGPDGLYVMKLPQDIIKRYAKLAKQNHAMLLLDIQLGRASVMHGVKAIAPYLKLPYVDLAIDTEYHVGKGEVPGEDLGHIDGAEIQQAIEYVNKVVKENNLPDKVVVVHQFAGKIINHKNLIKPTKHVEVVLNFDGFGRSAVKMAAYGKLVREQPIQYGGFKLFYKADEPLLSPKQVLKLDPAPAIVDYE